MLAQQKFLDTLAKMALNNRIALDNILADQGRVCAPANTSYSTWIHASSIIANIRN